MMKIKEAVKCVPVILGYFLLTEIGKMIEFWIFMAHQTESDLYEQQWSWITMPESRLFQIPARKLERNIASDNINSGCSIRNVLYQISGSHCLCYIHERYLFLYQRNRCTCGNTGTWKYSWKVFYPCHISWTWFVDNSDFLFSIWTIKSLLWL